jgi:hypothetical protein
MKHANAMRRLLFVGLLSIGAARTVAAQAAEMLLPQMPLHDPYILAYSPTKTYYLYT